MNCPTDEQLAQLAYGRVTGDELSTLEKHLDGCGTCRTLLAAVSNGSAPLTQPERAALQPGEKLGRYEIERLIAAGGMGMLYVARDPQLNRRVALKLMRPAFGGDVGRMRLLREAQAMAALSHPNVLQVFELGEVDGRVFVAMELVDGGTLRDFMKRPGTSWRDVVSTFVQAGRGLAAAHASGVVHRDFKPENVLLGKDGRPRVGDFGLSRPDVVAVEEPPPNLPMKVTHTGTMLGTPAYMSPEQLQGRPADARSDQYGFCVCLYEALAGKRPFPADTLEELRSRVSGGMPPPPKDGLIPANVWAAISRGLQPDPARRFPDMDALLAVLAFDEQPARGAASRAKGWAPAAAVIAALLGFGAFTFANRAPAMVPAVAPPPIPLAAAAAKRAPAQSAPEPEEREELSGPYDPIPDALAQKPEYQLGKKVELGVGIVRLFHVPGIERLAIGDTEIADIKTLGKDTVVVVGAWPGKTTLLVWTAHARLESTIEVTEDGPAGPAERTLDLEPGLQAVLDIPNLSRVSVGDTEIAEAKPIGDKELVVVGEKEGRTTVLAWTSDHQLHDYLVRVQRPAGTPALPSQLRIGVGMQRVLAVPGLRRIAIGDPAIADVKTIGNNQLLVMGVGKGKTTLLVWTASGERLSSTVDVVSEAAAGPEDADIELTPEMKKMLTVPGLLRLAVGDAAIAEVKAVGNDQVEIVGKKTGRTTLLLWLNDGKRRAYLLKVKKPGGG